MRLLRLSEFNAVQKMQSVFSGVAVIIDGLESMLLLFPLRIATSTRLDLLSLQPVLASALRMHRNKRNFLWFPIKDSNAERLPIRPMQP